jgi:methionine sulfoxide reductase heme-binding subunit
LMRGSGLVALLLLSGTVALGVVEAKRWHSRRWSRLLSAALHRNLPLLAVVFLAVHISTAVIDSFVGLGWVGVVVPFLSGYRPLWVGLGAIGFDLLLAVMLTSLLRARIGFRAWRAVHWTSWILWPVALSHALGAGTDAFAPLGLSVCCVSTAMVGAAALWRLRSTRADHAISRSFGWHSSPRAVPEVIGGPTASALSRRGGVGWASGTGALPSPFVDRSPSAHPRSRR